MNYYEETCDLAEADFIDGLMELTDQEVIDADASANQAGDLVRAHHAYILMCARLDDREVWYWDSGEPDPMMRAYHAWIERTTDDNLRTALSRQHVIRAMERTELDKAGHGNQ